MSINDMAKALGEELSKSEVYKNYVIAKSRYDADSELEELISAYNMEKINLEVNENKDTARLDS